MYHLLPMLMLRHIRTYRILPATVAVALVLGFAAPVAHALCASVMNVEEECNGHASGVMNEAEHVHSAPGVEESAHQETHMAPAKEPPASPELVCCLISAETDAATVAAVPHVPTVKLLAVPRLNDAVFSPAFDTAPTTHILPPQVVPEASSQSILSVFLI